MINGAGRKDIIWGYLAQFLNIGSGIIIIPVAIKYLTSEDMGLWYLFIAISGLVQLLEFGFQPTISRMVSYVYAGAKELLSEGVPEKGEKIDYQLLYDLIYASKKIYRYISIVASIFIIVAGTYYLNTFVEFKEEQMIAWLIFAFSTIVNFYFTYLNGIIIGKGSQSILYRITAVSKIFMLLISVPLLVLNYGLVSMAIGNCISVIIMRCFLYKNLNDRTKEDIKELSKIKQVVSAQEKIVWLSAWKLGFTSLGSFMILRANQFIASSYLGLKVAANYGLTIQIIGILSSVSSMYFTLNLPRINSLQSYGNKHEIKIIVRRSLVCVGSMYVLGCAAIFVVGIPVLEYFSTNTSFVPNNILIMMVVMYGLDLNHTLSGTYLTTLNKVPFMYAALISGMSIVSISFIIVNYTSFGLLGIICGQLLVQLLFNNWYWPLQVWRDLRTRNVRIKL